MYKTVGIDFGTTYSAISFIKNEEPILFPDEEKSETYHPTAITMVQNGSNMDISFNKTALIDAKGDGAELLRYFKMYMGISNKETILEAKLGNHLPKDLTKMYIGNICNEYKNKQNINGFSSVVVTVPEIWFSSEMMTAREEMQEVCRELFNDNFNLVSEPIAACAYFYHLFTKTEDKEFDGHVVVFDYGGGTLDITLCSINPNQGIKSILNFGRGDNSIYKGLTQPGHAGATFDRVLLEEAMIRAKVGNMPTNIAKINYNTLLDDLITIKRENSLKISNAIIEYQKSNQVDDTLVIKLYCQDGTPVQIYASNIVTVYENVIKQDLLGAIDELKAGLKQNNIDTNTNFKIVMVGGFSNFYLVEKELKNAFNAIDQDERFNDSFSLGDRSHAVVKGAVLLAAKKVKFIATVPIEVGLEITCREGTNDGFVYITKHEPFFQKGDVIVQEELRYTFGQSILINSGSMIFYRKINPNTNDVMRFQFEEKTKDVIQKKYVGQKCTLSMSINKNLIFSLIIMDENKKEDVYQLGHVTVSAFIQEN